MRFYIASGFENKENVQKVSSQLVQAGFLHTYDWTKNERADTFEKLQNIGKAEKEGVKSADFVVVILPGGKGTHVELGLALAFEKTIFLYNEIPISEPTLSCTFYHLQSVEMVNGSITNLIKIITKNYEV